MNAGARKAGNGQRLQSDAEARRKKGQEGARNDRMLSRKRGHERESIYLEEVGHVC